MSNLEAALIGAICEEGRAPKTKEAILAELNHPDVTCYWWWWQYCPLVITNNWQSLSFESKLVAMLMGAETASYILANMD